MSDLAVLQQLFDAASYAVPHVGDVDRRRALKAALRKASALLRKNQGEPQ